MQKKVITLLTSIIIVFIGISVYRDLTTPVNFTSQFLPIAPAIEEPAESKTIVVDHPVLNEQISSPFTVSGKARLLENVLNYRLSDSTDKILVEGQGQLTPSVAGNYTTFELTINFSQPQTEYGVLTVYSSDTKAIVVVKFPAWRP